MQFRQKFRIWRPISGAAPPDYSRAVYPQLVRALVRLRGIASAPASPSWNVLQTSDNHPQGSPNLVITGQMLCHDAHIDYLVFPCLAA